MRWCPLWEREPLEKWWNASTETSKLARTSSDLSFGLRLSGRHDLFDTRRSRRQLNRLVNRETFAYRVSARDERVAVKILRNIECFRDAARSEVAVLEEINSLDDDNRL